MICPHCRHSDGLHSGLAAGDGLADDGEVLAADYVAGQCGESTRRPDRSWEPCPCPGWYPNTTRAQLDQATTLARFQRLARGLNVDAPEIAPVPFALSSPVSTAKGLQLGLRFDHENS
jgi:hypothetical protein